MRTAWGADFGDWTGAQDCQRSSLAHVGSDPTHTVCGGFPTVLSHPRLRFSHVGDEKQAAGGDVDCVNQSVLRHGVWTLAACFEGGERRGQVDYDQTRCGREEEGLGGKKVGGPGMQGGGIGGGHGAGGGGPDHVAGFTTKRKRRISKDRQLLKRLQDVASGKAGDEAASQAAIGAANVMMRRYFADLTERFLAPLNRYVASLVPATFNLSSPSEVPKIRPFNTTDFLASLKAHGTPLAIRSRSLPTGASVRQSLYLDFLKCPNFSLWLHSRVAAAEEEQRRRYIASLLQGDVAAFGRDRGEIETIDLYSRLVEEIRLVDVQLTAPTEPGPGSRWRTDKPKTGVQDSGTSTPTYAVGATTTEKRLKEQKVKLMRQLEKLCETLPEDLRGCLRRPA